VPTDLSAVLELVPDPVSAPDPLECMGVADLKAALEGLEADTPADELQSWLGAFAQVKA
jgi:hypothetical protein